MRRPASEPDPDIGVAHEVTLAARRCGQSRSSASRNGRELWLLLSTQSFRPTRSAPEAHPLTSPVARRAAFAIRRLADLCARPTLTRVREQRRAARSRNSRVGTREADANASRTLLASATSTGLTAAAASASRPQFAPFIYYNCLRFPGNSGEMVMARGGALCAKTIYDVRCS